jgi:hypothetical protein
MYAALCHIYFMKSKDGQCICVQLSTSLHTYPQPGEKICFNIQSTKMSDSDGCFGMIWEICKLSWVIAEWVVQIIYHVIKAIIVFIQEIVEERRANREEMLSRGVGPGDETGRSVPEMAQPARAGVPVMEGPPGGDTEKNIGTMIQPTTTTMSTGGLNVNSMTNVREMARPIDWGSGQKAQNGIVVGTMALMVEPKQTRTEIEEMV